MQVERLLEDQGRAVITGCEYPRPMHRNALRQSDAHMHCWMGSSLFQAIHYNDVIMRAIASQITSLTIVYSIVYSDADQENIKASRHWRGIHRGPLISPHKWPVTRKMFPFDDIIMACRLGVMMIVLSWNLTGFSAALLPSCLSNFRAIGKV